MILSLGCSGPSDPYHAPGKGGLPPDVVVVIEEPNSPYDLIPREVNGVSVRTQFNDDNGDNDGEPLRLPPGRVRFFVKNVGSLTHDLKVDGNGVDEKTRNIGPRRTAEMELTLEEGTYTMYCSIGDHRARGMKRTLIITPEAKYPAPVLN